MDPGTLSTLSVWLERRETTRQLWEYLRLDCSAPVGDRVSWPVRSRRPPESFVPPSHLAFVRGWETGASHRQDSVGGDGTTLWLAA